MRCAGAYGDRLTLEKESKQVEDVHTEFEKYTSAQFATQLLVSERRWV